MTFEEVNNKRFIGICRGETFSGVILVFDDYVFFMNNTQGSLVSELSQPYRKRMDETGYSKWVFKPRDYGLSGIFETFQIQII